MTTTQSTFTFGDALARARKAARLEQADVAKAAGVSRPLVSRWENNRSFPDVRQLRAIVDLTGAEWLYDRDILHTLSMETVGSQFGALDLPERELVGASA